MILSHSFKKYRLQESQKYHLEPKKLLRFNVTRSDFVSRQFLQKGSFK
jgi:hypothetical protein